MFENLADHTVKQIRSLKKSNCNWQKWWNAV